MVQNGKVLSVDGEMVMVETVRQSACDGCHTKAFCPSCKKKMTARAYNAAKADVGDLVEISTPSGVILQYAAFIFVLPLVIGLVFYMAGQLLFESMLASYLLSFAFFVASFLFLGFFLNRREVKKNSLTVVKIIEKA
ncbi:MAG: SoxR reducing system RseC family protein [Clostridiales bacterium]|nr:SoxR reducing system RseC family protein [Clostridiales bacterium]